MKNGNNNANNILSAQKQHWENTYCEEPRLFGEKPSYSAIRAAKLFQKEKAKKILELGGGHGRDTIFFATRKFHINVLDYCDNSIETIKNTANQLHISKYINPSCHDVREKLSYPNEFFDACYSHMLFCMALTTIQLEFIFQEVRRVLKPKGILVYTARNTNDVHFRHGIHRGEYMYENGGFIVHFFDKEKVETLAKGYEILNIEEFEEGELPRKLFVVTLRKEEN